MSPEPGRAAGSRPPAGHGADAAAGPRTPSRGSGLGRPRFRAGQIPGDVIPADGGRDSDPRGPRDPAWRRTGPGPPPGVAAILVPERRPAAATQPGVNPSTRPPGMPPAGTRPAMARPGRRGRDARFGTAGFGTALLGTALLGTALLGTALLGTARGGGAEGGTPPDRAIPPPEEFSPTGAAGTVGALKAASGSASSSPARPSALSPPWWSGARPDAARALRRRRHGRPPRWPSAHDRPDAPPVPVLSTWWPP